MPKEMRGPIVRFETCSVLLCVLEESRVDNPGAGPNWKYLVVTTLRQMRQMPHTEIDDVFLFLFYAKILFKKYKI